MGADPALLRRREAMIRLSAAVLALLLGSAASVSAHGGTAETYRWAGGAEGGTVPGRTAELRVGTPADLWTPDGQAVVSLPANALRGPEGRSVTVTLAPGVAGDLGPLPDGLAPAGNAYAVDLPLAAPGAIVLAGGHPVTAILHSADGRAWERLEHRPAGDGRLEAPLVASGWYLAAGAADHHRPPLDASVAALLVAGVLLAVGVVRRRTVRRTSAPSGTTEAWTS